MNATGALDESAIEAAAREIASRASAAADRTEQARALDPEVVESLKSAGVFRLCVPRSAGGAEAHVGTLIRSIEAVAAGDGSAGWCVMIGATSGLIAGYLDAEAAREVFAADPTVVSGGVFAPNGRATVEPGGYRVGGRWSFASGSGHSDWLMGGCIVMDGDAPRTVAGGGPDIRLMVFPRAEVETIDTWSVSGLCGTGSHDIAVADVFVPEGRSASFLSDRPREEGPLFRFPVFSILAIGIAAVALGIARRATDELIGLAAAKTPSGSRKRLGARAHTQMQVAEADAELASARALLFERAGCAWDAAVSGPEIGVVEKAKLRLAASHAVKASARVVDRMYELGGGTSIYRTSVLQRCFRDVHTATQHLMVSPSTYELTGRVLLGEAVDTSQL